MNYRWGYYIKIFALNIWIKSRKPIYTNQIILYVYSIFMNKKNESVKTNTGQ